MNGAVLRYSGWMSRDVLLGPGAVMAAVAALIAFVLSRMGSMDTSLAGSQELVRQILGQSLPLLILVATAHMVSGDLGDGYYRVYFSRPISPRLYYLQRWLLGAVAIGLYVALVGLAVASRTKHLGLQTDFFLKAGLLYLMLGGAVFFFSTLTRRDWAAAGLLLLLQAMLHGVQEAGADIGAIARTLHAVLPPFHLASLSRPLGDAGAITHAVSYGLAMVVAALAVLRWRPLGSGGRA